MGRIRTAHAVDDHARRSASRQRKLAALISGAIYFGPLLLAMILGLLPLPSGIAGIILFGSYALVMAVSALVGIAIARVTPPLPAVADRSILARRLIWFGRFVLAAILVLWATFVNDRWAALQGSAGYALQAFAIDTVFYPIALGVLVAMVWLAVDLARLGVGGRQQALARVGLKGRLLAISLAVADPLWMVPASVILGLVAVVALAHIST